MIIILEEEESSSSGMLFYLLFAHDAQLGQTLELLSLGGLLRQLLWAAPSCRAQCRLLLRPCYTNTGHGFTVGPPPNTLYLCPLFCLSLSPPCPLLP